MKLSALFLALLIIALVPSSAEAQLRFSLSGILTTTGGGATGVFCHVGEYLFEVREDESSSE